MYFNISIKLSVYSLNPQVTNVIYIYIYRAPILDVSRSHTTTQHSRQDSSGRVISSSQRPLPVNTHNTSNTVAETSTRQHTQHQQHRRRDLYQTTHTTVATPSQRHLPDNTHNTSNTVAETSTSQHTQHQQQTPTVSAGERQQNYTLDRAATGIGVEELAKYNIKICNKIVHIILYITCNN